jgi:hypothetical protein
LTTEPAKGCSGNSDLLADLRRWQAKIDTLPPAPHAIMAHHSVPYGRAFKQWDARGRLLIWANRGEIADLPRQNLHGIDVLSSILCPPGLVGVPVVNVDV